MAAKKVRRRKNLLTAWRVPTLVVVLVARLLPILVSLAGLGLGCRSRGFALCVSRGLVLVFSNPSGITIPCYYQL